MSGVTKCLRAIGSKIDPVTGDTVCARVHAINDHIHSPSKVYPTLAAGVTVTADAASWTLGSFTEVVPADTIASVFDIHWVSLEGISANGVYELVLYYGDTDIECGRDRFTKNANLDSTLNVPMQTPLIPANSKIRAKLASDNAVADTVDISLFYHVY